MSLSEGTCDLSINVSWKILSCEENDVCNSDDTCDIHIDMSCTIYISCTIFSFEEIMMSFSEGTCDLNINVSWAIFSCEEIAICNSLVTRVISILNCHRQSFHVKKMLYLVLRRHM